MERYKLGRIFVVAQTTEHWTVSEELSIGRNLSLFDNGIGEVSGECDLFFVWLLVGRKHRNDYLPGFVPDLRVFVGRLRSRRFFFHGCFSRMKSTGSSQYTSKAPSKTKSKPSQNQVKTKSKLNSKSGQKQVKSKFKTRSKPIQNP